MARTWIIVPAAGGGARFGATPPKQYADLAGIPLLARTLDRLGTLDAETIVVVLAPDDVHFDSLIGTRRRVEPLRCGGITRTATVRNALRALARTCGADDWILVHDAARPCVPRESLARLVRELADDAVGGLLALPLADTLKRSGPASDAPRVMRTEDRAGLWLAQTPQMFRYRILCDAHALDTARDCTDDAQAIEALSATGACAMPRLVTGTSANIKVTYPGDLALAAAILTMQGGA
ncbi:MAG: 2-C-methyl-D-erythritol 4-phosphate cytidylyltransferase [Casimicrobiaceae bacterium]|nr:2-C-methyl-D-erythritol 4-phosphate cytidylyltransferase [Pseudomonadota bacterium]